MDTTRFLEYLHRDEATAALADAFRELISARRAAVERRAVAAKQRRQHRMSVAS